MSILVFEFAFTSFKRCPVTATYNSQIQIQTIERHF